MKTFKLLFSTLAVAFAILGLTKTLSADITLPVTFVSLAITFFLTAKEQRNNDQTSTATYFLLVGLFLLLITAYNVASMIWGV